MKQKNFLNQLILFSCLLLFSGMTAYGQITVNGTVISSQDNQPVPGVNVVVKDASKGAVTDFDGKYTLNDISSSDILIFSYLGFKTIEVKVGSQTTIDVSMEEDSAQLDEVVVVGYGTQKKSDLTGALSSVSSEDFEKVPVTRIGQALQGRAAGVQVTQTGGGPAAGFKIRIRGANSIAGNNDPLYVLDGIVVGNINTLNPNDIESFEVLKDASSTAVYGSRGANGVVLITTKKGKKGKAKIEFQSFASVSNVTQRLDYMTAAQFAEGVNFTDNLDPSLPYVGTFAQDDASYSEIFSQEEIDGLRVNGGEDWHDRLFRTAYAYNAQLSVSGGSDNVDYYISSSYLDSDGTIVDQDVKRYTLRANINAKVSDRLKIGLNSFLSHQKTSGERADLGSGLTWDPTTFAFDEDGNYNEVSDDIGNGTPNPLLIPENNIQENIDNRITLGAYANYDITDNLVFNVSGGLDRLDEINNRFQSTILTNGIATVANDNLTRLQNTNRLTYTLDKNPDHRLTIDAIHEQQVIYDNDRTTLAEGFFTDETGFKDLALAELSSNTSSFRKESLQSGLGRVNYSLFNKFLFTASVRADGSSKFRDGDRWGVFPSGSIAWKLSEENFIKESSTINNLKVRFSYGQIGSQAISVFDTRSIPIINIAQNYSFTGDAFQVGVAASNRLANPDLTWETTTQGNVGIDLGLWNSKVNITLDLYKKNTEDLLLDKVLPEFVGPTVQTINIGEVENKGFDITLGLNLVNTKNWNVNSTLSLSSNRNEVLELIDGEPLEIGSDFRGVSPSRVEVGLPLGSFRGYVFDGVWQLGEEEEAAVFNRKPGDAKYVDINGDGAITAEEDITTVGDPNADFTWGWNWDVSYKNFNVNFAFTGSQGNDIYNFTKTRFYGLGALQFHGVDADLANRWSTTNPSNIPASRDNTEILSTQFIEDGSYITLKNVAFSYDFDSKVVDSIGLAGLNLFVNAENLFIITDYTGFDPEATATGTTIDLDVNPGIDLNTYPLARTVSFGLKATF